ncbi:MAG: DNRLRE domain-containing protein, partial [Chloroflexota bacterium]
SYGHEPFLRVGYNAYPGYGKQRLAIRFDLAQLPQDVVVDEATLRLYCQGGTRDDPMTVAAHVLTGSWDEANAGWDRLASRVGALQSAVALRHGLDGGYWAEWDVHSAVQAWASGEWAFGFVLIGDEDQGAVPRLRVFQSREASDPAYWPHLRVRYHTPCPLPAAPALLAPADGATVYYATFTWSAVATATSYVVQVAEPFAVPGSFETTETSQSWPDYPFVCSGDYFWRVRAVNACGAGPWSATRRLVKTYWTPEDLSPDDGALFAFGATVSLDAEFAYGRYQVAREPEFATLVVAESTDIGEPCTMAGLAPGTYYWRAAALDHYCCEYGPWSAVRRFVILEVAHTLWLPLALRGG